MSSPPASSNCDSGGGCLFVGNVERQRFGPLTDITGCLVQRRLLAPVEPHLRPMRDQLARNLEPESPCRSGHQRRAPFE